MKNFLFYLVKIFAITFFAAFAIESFADRGLKKIEASIFQDWEKILEGDLNSELVISGSSRGAVSYDPKILQNITDLKSYNLSYNAGSFNLQYLKMEAYLKRNKAPKVIIQNVDIAHFSRTNAIPEAFQFLPFLHDNELREGLVQISNKYQIYRYVPLFKYNNYHTLLINGILSGLGKDLNIHSTKQGYIAVDKSFTIDEHNLQRLKELNKIPSVLNLYSEGLDSTRSFLKEKVPTSTQVFLVWAPEFKKRRETISGVTPLIRQEIKKIIKEMPNVHFLYYGDDPISDSSAYFYDTFHLNKEGSEIFSYKISSEIKNILDEKHAF